MITLTLSICLIRVMVTEKILQKKLNLSDAQIKYVENAKQGDGLIVFGDIVLPFSDSFPEDTLMFKLLNTDPTKK